MFFLIFPPLTFFFFLLYQSYLLSFSLTFFFLVLPIFLIQLYRSCIFLPCQFPCEMIVLFPFLISLFRYVWFSLQKSFITLWTVCGINNNGVTKGRRKKNILLGFNWTMSHISWVTTQRSLFFSFAIKPRAQKGFCNDIGADKLETSSGMNSHLG